MAGELTGVVLVGHSFGGSVIAGVAEQVPDRLRRLVFNNAFVPLSGQCLLYRLAQMPGSHEALLVDPAGLADKIVEAGPGLTGRGRVLTRGGAGLPGFDTVVVQH